MTVIQQLRMLIAFYGMRFLIKNGMFLLKNGAIVNISEMPPLQKANVLLFLDVQHPRLGEDFREAVKKMNAEKIDKSGWSEMDHALHNLDVQLSLTVIGMMLCVGIVFGYGVYSFIKWILF